MCSCQQVPALEGPRPVDGYGTSGQPVDALITWPYVNKNRLYYDSSEHEAVALTDRELALQVQVHDAPEACGCLCQASL